MDAWRTISIAEVLLDSLLDDYHFKDLVTRGSVRSSHLKKSLDQLSHVHRVMARNWRVTALQHSLEETVHVVGTEGWDQRAHLIQDATQRPDVRLQVIRLVFPDLWRSVVWCPRLGVEKSLFGHF